MTTRLLAAALLLAAAPAAASDGMKPSQFLATYCVDCHGEYAEEGDRRFDRLTDAPSTTADLELWQDALDRINLGDMPPEEAEQPAPEDRVAAAETIRAMIDEAAHKLAGESETTVLRRLTRREYDASVRDVLALPDLQADLTGDFPPDPADHHFRNIGESMVLSDYLLGRYLDAAAAYLDAADVRGERPPSKTYTLNAPFHIWYDAADAQDVEGEYQNIRNSFHDSGGFLWLQNFNRKHKGVPHSGRYRIRVRAAGVNREHPYADWHLKVPKEDPIRMAVVAADGREGPLDTVNPTDRLLGEFELPDIETAGEPRWFELEAWLDQGMQPRIGYSNGPLSVKMARWGLIQKNRDLFPRFIRDHVHVFHGMHPDYDPVEGPKLAAAFVAEQQRLRDLGLPNDVFGVDHQLHTPQGWKVFTEEYVGPRVRVYEVSIEGPLTETWPPESTRRLYGEGDVSDETAPGLIGEFATRAFRRPAGDDDLAPLVSLYETRRAGGDAPRDALLLAYRAVLCSPQFVYVRQTPGTPDAYDLASRLSYFLWAAPPDEALLAAAADGSLSDGETLRSHAVRMLDDPRSAALYERLADSWLGLDRLGTMLPSTVEHRAYFTENLEDAMRREVLMLLEDASNRNRPTAELTDRRDTFVNGPLARLYGIPGVTGHTFVPATHTDPARGGLATTAAVLTATANGIDTSPVVRGVWVLESMLGTPPSPPPPDIEPIEPDTRGATTIREQLAAHRTVETCAACHRAIDPPGFALEAFDEVGRFRTEYALPYGTDADPLPVDASGVLRGGESFAGPAEFVPLLRRRSELFARNAATQILTLAAGRHPGVADRGEMQRLAESQPDGQIGFRDLILGVVTSEAFARNPAP